jgi:hypothetical protein
MAVGQWLEEQLNIETFRMLRVGTRKPTASRTEGQDLVPLKIFTKKMTSMLHRLTCNLWKFNSPNVLIKPRWEEFSLDLKKMMNMVMYNKFKYVLLTNC